MCGPAPSDEVGPGNGNHGPKVWIDFQEQVKASGDRPGRLEIARGHNNCWSNLERLTGVILLEIEGCPFLSLVVIE